MVQMFTVAKNTPLDKKLIEAALEYNEAKRDYYNENEAYYVGNHVILKREPRSEFHANNMVVINHAKYIVDTKVAYLLGNAVSYQTKEGNDITNVIDLYDKQTIANVDFELAKVISMFGHGYDYSFTVKNDVRTKPIDPRHCVVIYDDTIEHNKLYAIMYREVKTDGGEKKYIGVRALDKLNTYEFDEKLEKVLTTKLHGFNEAPVNEYKNNKECMGDFDSVKSLINAYNTVQSDRVNDKEQLVAAILLLKGFGLTSDQIEGLKKSRTLKAPKDGDASYITKQLDESEVDILRQNLEADIHKISMTPNLSDEKFVGNSSGVAIEYKLIAFEQSTMNKERPFEEGLLKRMKLYIDYLVKIKVMKKNVEIHNVDVVFKRNLPRNDLEISQIINNLMGIVSRKKLKGLLGFVNDVEADDKELEAEMLELGNAESPDFGKEGKDKKTKKEEDE